MQLEKLEYFLEVARTHSINQAAINLNISHQALNQSMHILQKELGVKLFDGNYKGVVLTEKGEMVSQSAEKIVQEWQQLKQNLDESLNYSGQLIIGLAPYMESFYYSKLWVYMRDRYPEIQIRMINVYLDEAIARLEERELDMAILSLFSTDIDAILEENKFLEYIPLQKFTSEFLVHKNSPLAKKKKLFWEDVRDYPLIFSRLGDAEKNHLLKKAKASGCNNIIMVHSDDMLQEMVANNLGNTYFTNQSVVRDEYKNKTVRIPFDENTESENGIFLCKDRVNDTVIQLLIKRLKMK